MNEVSDAVYDVLAAESALTTLIGGTASPRIFRNVAPQGADLPYVTFQLVGGPGDENIEPSDLVNLLYLAQGVSTVSPAQASTLASHIRTALHDKTLSVSGWSNFWTRAEGVVETAEIDHDSGQVFHRSGRFVRVRLAKTS